MEAMENEVEETASSGERSSTETMESQLLSATHDDDDNEIDNSFGAQTPAPADNDHLLVEGPPSIESQRRWHVLSLTCLVMTCIYYSLDIPAALHQQLHDSSSAATDTDELFEWRFNLLFTIYSMPNIILPFMGGYIVDNLGASFCLVLFAAVCCLGQVLFAVGVARMEWNTMILGRFVYGLGGESICVAYSTLLASWFAEGQELAVSFGIALAVSRLGSVFNDVVSPWTANVFSTTYAVSFGALLNTGALVASMIIWYLDKTYGNDTRRSVGGQEATLNEPLLSGEDADNELEPREVETADDVSPTSTENRRESGCDALKFGNMFWLLALSCLVVYACVLPWNNVASGILLERDLFRDAPSDCRLRYPDQCTVGKLVGVNDTNSAVRQDGGECILGSSVAPLLPDSLNVTGSDGIHHLIQNISAGDVDCKDSFWYSDCTQDYCKAKNQATERAGRYMAIPYTISAIMSPLLGKVVDSIGKRALLSSTAALVLFVVHLSLALSSMSPVLPLVGQGLSYALYAAVLWPSVTLIAPPEKTGRAFGILTSIQNIGLAGFPLIVALIYRRSGMLYIPSVEIFFASCAGIGVFVGAALHMLDRVNGNKLNRPRG